MARGGDGAQNIEDYTDEDFAHPRPRAKRDGGGGGGGRRGKGGAGAGAGGGGHGRPQDRETLVSKKLSWILRHGAVSKGMRVLDGGWVNVEELLRWQPLRSLGLAFPELQTVVLENAKQRFQIAPAESPSSSAPASAAATTTTTTTADTTAAAADAATAAATSSAGGGGPLVVLSALDAASPASHVIRATQGHSLAVVSSAALLTALTPADIPDRCPALVVHGTDAAAWALIRESGGLKRMRRRHVHFARGVPGDGDWDGPGGEDEAQRRQAAPAVVSGMRGSATVLVWVDVRRSMVDGGLRWYLSANGVVLTEGDARGMVGLEWVARAERRGRDAGAAREVLWRQGG